MGRIVAGIRLDHLRHVLNAIAQNKELEAILGSPVERHVAVVVRDGKFRFNQLTPHGEEKKTFTPEDEARVRKIVDKIMHDFRPGMESLPEVK